MAGYENQKMKKKPLNSSMASSSSSTSAEEEAAMVVGPTIPTDLIINILSRLPAKSLGKFKCVSKQWLHIITDPYFTSMHRSLALLKPNVLLLKNTRSFEENKTTQMKKSTKIDVCSMDFDGNKNLDFVLTLDHDDVGSIFLLPSKWDLICFADENNGFYVCNPSTQELVKLPDASCCTSGDTSAGFGYIKERNEYVLVHLFDRSLDILVDFDIGCEILRLTDGCCVKDCSWKVVEANCPYVVRGWGVLVENVFYWMIFDEYDSPGEEAILLFDLEKEEFGTVSPPEGCFDPHAIWSLVELRGRLCLVDNATRPFTMDIWVLKDHQNHVWVREYSIDLNGFSDDLLKYIIPLDDRDGEILMDAKHVSLDYYDVENRCFKKMDNLIAGEWRWLRLYTESFFSLGSR